MSISSCSTIKWEYDCTKPCFVWLRICIILWPKICDWYINMMVTVFLQSVLYTIIPVIIAFTRLIQIWIIIQTLYCFPLFKVVILGGIVCYICRNGFYNITQSFWQKWSNILEIWSLSNLESEQVIKSLNVGSKLNLSYSYHFQDKMADKYSEGNQGI